MARVAILITAYHKVEQLLLVIDSIKKNSDQFDVYVHFDKKVSLSDEDFVRLNERDIFITREYSIYWGGYSQLQSIMHLVHLASRNHHYDFYILMSAQDFFVKSCDYVLSFLERNKAVSFVDCFSLPDDRWNYNSGLGRIEWFWFMDYVSRYRGVQRLQKTLHKLSKAIDYKRPSSKNIKFYGGSDWWIISGRAMDYCLDKFNSDSLYRKLFKYSFIPTEMYFQTTIMNSKFACQLNPDARRYIPWEDPRKSSHPNIITQKDIHMIDSGDYLLARKFDKEVDSFVFDYYLRKFSGL